MTSPEMPPPQRGEGGWWMPEPGGQWRWAADAVGPVRRRTPWRLRAGGALGAVAVLVVVGVAAKLGEDHGGADAVAAAATASPEPTEAAAPQVTRPPVPTETPPPTMAEVEESEARRVCRVLLPDKVKAPSTVKFDLDRETAHEDRPDAWSVRSEFDSENGFSAMLRSGYLCGVTFTPGSSKASVQIWVYECPCKRFPEGQTANGQETAEPAV